MVTENKLHQANPAEHRAPHANVCICHMSVCSCAPGCPLRRRRRGGWACHPGTRSASWGCAPRRSASRRLQRFGTRRHHSAKVIVSPEDMSRYVRVTPCLHRRWSQRVQHGPRIEMTLHIRLNTAPVPTWNRRSRLSSPAVSSSWPLGWNSTQRTTAVLGSALLASASGVTYGEEKFTTISINASGLQQPAHCHLVSCALDAPAQAYH